MATANALSINTDATAAAMAEAIFGTGITVVSANDTSPADASGICAGTDLTMPGVAPSAEGVILSTGSIRNVTSDEGGNGTHPGTSTTDSDAGLSVIAGHAIHDAAVLDSTFVPDGQFITMRFAFASEDHPELAGASAGDVAGIRADGVKVAATLVQSGRVAGDGPHEGSHQMPDIDNGGAVDGSTFMAPVPPDSENTPRIGSADGRTELHESSLMIAGDSIQTGLPASDAGVLLASNVQRIVDVPGNDQAIDGAGWHIPHILDQANLPDSPISLPTGAQVTHNPDDTLTTRNGSGSTGRHSITDTHANAGGETDISILTLNTAGRDGIVLGINDDDIIDRIDHGDGSGFGGGDGDGDYVVADLDNDLVLIGAGDDLIFGGAELGPGATLRGSEGDARLIRIDSVDSVIPRTILGQMGTVPAGTGVTPDGIAYATGSNQIWRFDPDNPAGATRGWTDPAGGFSAGDIALSGDKANLAQETACGLGMADPTIGADGNAVSSQMPGLLPHQTYDLTLGPEDEIYAMADPVVYRLTVPDEPIHGGHRHIPVLQLPGASVHGAGSYFGGDFGGTAVHESGQHPDPGDGLSGGDGDDTIRGGEGNDRLNGGEGDADDDDFDPIDLSTLDPATYRLILDESNPENGVIEFLDAAGNATSVLPLVDIEQVIPCLTPGSRVMTIDGAIPVEAITPGDLVLTRDGGYQPVRWVGRRDLGLPDMLANPRFAPVCIAAGALGWNLPERDMIVSPQHRMLLSDPLAELQFGEREVLVAACHLVGRPGIGRLPPRAVSYIHLLLDRHEIIHVDGSWTESYQPGVASLPAAADPQREELLALFPELAEGMFWPAARVTLKRHEAALLSLG